MAIFGQFTKRAQQVLMTAQECATREGQPYVGTLHFLYGLLDVGEAPESVTRHIQKEDVKQVLDQIDDEVSLHPGHGPVQMTPRARRVLDGSIIESRRLGQLYVGTEHMWLGILANPNCKAAELLAQEHIAAQVVKLNRVTPLDGDAVCGALAGVRRLVVLEDQLRQGCVGQRLAALLLERGAAPEKLRLLNAGERLPAQGSVRQLYHALGMDAQGVVCRSESVV